MWEKCLEGHAARDGIEGAHMHAWWWELCCECKCVRLWKFGTACTVFMDWACRGSVEGAARDAKGWEVMPKDAGCTAWMGSQC